MLSAFKAAAASPLLQYERNGPLRKRSIDRRRYGW
jgi:hypothetical protein